MLFPAKSIYPVITGICAQDGNKPHSTRGLAGEGSWPRGKEDAWFHSATPLGMRAGWETLGKAVSGRKTFFYQKSIFLSHTFSFKQFLALDEISGQTLREKREESLKQLSPWLKAITRKCLNPCTLSSSGVGDCMWMCQRHKFLWPGIWSFAKLLTEAPRPVLFAKNNCSCRVSDSYQQEWAPVKVPVSTYSSVLDLCFAVSWFNVLNSPRDPVFWEEMLCCSPEQKTLLPSTCSPVIWGFSEEFSFSFTAQFLLSIQQQKPLSLMLSYCSL